MKILALIGVGRWGRNIVSTLESFPLNKLKYLCARSKESLAPYSKKYEKLLDWQELLKKKDVDAVLVATPPSTHASIAVPFLERGIPVFLEKPMTLSLAEAEQIAEAASRKHAVVFVGHVHIYNPAYRAAKAAALSCGSIRAIHTIAGKVGPFRDNFSVLWDWAPHDIAISLDLIGDEPKSVQAWGSSLLRPSTKLYDKAYLKLAFSRGRIATIQVSWLEPISRKEVSIIAGDSIVTFDDAISEKKVTLFHNVLPAVNSSKRTPIFSRQKTKTTFPSYGNERPLAEELKAFLDCVSNKTKPVTDIAQGLSVVKILEAAEQSIARNGEEVFLK